MKKADAFHLGVVVPLEEELLAFQQVFPVKCNLTSGSTFRAEVETGSDLRMIVVQQEGMGRTNAQIATDKLLRDYEIGLVVCLGIAGGLGIDISIGDVCYSGSVLDVYDNSKASDDENGGVDLQFSPTYYETPRLVTGAFNFIRTFPEYRESYNAWINTQYEQGRRLLPDSYQARGGLESVQAPRSLEAIIACGAVNTSSKYREKLLKLNRKIIAIETEAGGVFAVATDQNRPAIVIRGISDYADREKGKFEGQTKSGARAIAALNAVTFLKLQLTNATVANYLRNNLQEPSDLFAKNEDHAQTDVEFLSALLVDINSRIDSHLKDLSPEFRLQARGYKLPVPRARAISESPLLTGSVMPDAVEIRDLVAQQRHVVLVLPKSYPDSSLPWVIAHDLLGAEMNGRQVLPIVIDGVGVRPPSGSFSTLSHVNFVRVKSIDSAQAVVVIDSPPISSRTRAKFLVEQIVENDDVKFVFVLRYATDTAEQFKFAQQIGATVFGVSGFSFGEIAHFMRTNFEMEFAEAEAIALKLRGTFRRYQLEAHPTYFAGLSKQSLLALLQANRRAELLQLATDGFLSYVVADDQASLVLSRTTRFRFLRRLALAIKADEKTFNQSDLVSFTSAFAKEFDYDIDPIEFISSFASHGIIHFVDDQVAISLPFIEAYVLAAELRDNPEKAKAYFLIDRPTFDLATFDIYSELGPHSEVIQTIFGWLAEQVAILKRGYSPQSSSLLSNRVQPPYIVHPDRVGALEIRLRKAYDGIRAGTSQAIEKQRLIDAAEKVVEAVAERSREKIASTSEDLNDDHKRLNAAFRIWSIAVILLGSGAEHISAEEKRQLIRSILDLTAPLMEEWTAVAKSLDLEGLRSAVSDEGFVREFLGEAPERHEITAMKSLLGNFVDIVEFRALYTPIWFLFYNLCDVAHHKVLLSSIEAVEPSGLLESVIRGVWLTDVEAKRGLVHLRNALKQVRSADFLRFCIAQLFLARVYWNHSRKDDATLLLSAASESLKPLKVRIPSERRAAIINHVEKD